MKSRTLFAWVISALIHASVLVTVGALTLAGGRPAKPGVTEMVVSLAPPAEKPAAPPAPAKAAPAPTPKPEPKPKPKVKPKPKPVAKPKPEPKPEPSPEPVVAKKEKKTEQETREKNDSEQAASQPQQVGAKGMAGDPGEGVHQSGDTENALNKYLAKVRDTIDYNKQYPHRARMRRQEGTVKVSFWINAAGRAEKVAVVESSGSRILDRATQELVSRLRFDAPPKDLDSIPVEILAPVDYDLSNS